MDLIVRDIGTCDYAAALQLQQTLTEQVKADGSKAFLVLVEHNPPVITLGKAADSNNVLAGREQLAAEGMQLHQTSRGGDVTYHGPGQIVGYPILDLNAFDRDVHAHIRRLEETLIRTLERFDIQGRREEGLTGVWTDRGKIAAIGVAVSRWVTSHGFALNVCPDMAHYDHIVPCGISDKPVTSMAAVLGSDIKVQEVKPVLIQCFRNVHGFEK